MLRGTAQRLKWWEQVKEMIPQTAEWEGRHRSSTWSPGSRGVIGSLGAGMCLGQNVFRKMTLDQVC